MKQATILTVALAAVVAATGGCSATGPAASNGVCRVADVRDQDRIIDALGYFPDRPSTLAAAILCDDATAAEAALKAGSDPNAREPGGETPLLIAAAIPRARLLERLLAAGGDPNSWERDTRTLALQYALSAGIQYDDWSAWDMLLAKGADINCRPPGGATIAEQAVSLGAMDKLLQLLERGYRADPARLVRSLEAVHYDAKMEPLRLKALERARGLASAG